MKHAEATGGDGDNPEVNDNCGDGGGSDPYNDIIPVFQFVTSRLDDLTK